MVKRYKLLYVQMFFGKEIGEYELQYDSKNKSIGSCFVVASGEY